ncbi:porin family protein [Mangrovibacterium diazotrophicum]|uniref:Outer membrane beta-barrel protein n=1 Tax=Mangrovibacterium diazotrophicum TaxID=1261403 RepID=A0A419W382_9BACT|nr:hypothetical protein [Mangrovibacterium diazotrophicum]RKD89760.1 hypothetical protein BC643_0092 [Mangrovibacterium diazotrophicum]
MHKHRQYRSYQIHGILLVLFLCMSVSGRAQKDFTGKVTYVTSQHVYARFDGANDLQVGDTIFIQTDGQMKPLMVIESKSSYSAVGKPFPGNVVSLGQEVVGRSAITIKAEEKVESEKSVSPDEELVAASDSVVQTKKGGEFKQNIRGRISLSSYSSLSNATSSDSHRMRFSLSLQANHINNSRFSAETYTNFSFLSSDWAAVQDNLFNALKIYSLAVRYQAGEQSEICLGRKTNPNLSNVGAIDGLQFETGSEHFRAGAIAGFRPDYSDYGFNADLLEYGAYIAHQSENEEGAVRSSLAFFNQTNNGKTDRRFLYLQHSNSLARNLFLFLSSEVDLYQNHDNISTNTFRLTSFYISARYRFNQQLWLDASYDNRKNVIYYETFKSLVDQLMEEATRQGVQFRVNYRPFQLITIGFNANYRKRDSDPKSSTSFYSFLSFNQVPGIDATFTLSANVLKTVYVDGSVFGLRVYKDFLDDKLSSAVGYRYVDYRFPGSESSLLQHEAEIDLTWQITRKLALSLNYEATFEKRDHYNRIYINLTKRF